MNFTMIWLESKTLKSFLLLTLIVLFTACRREDSELNLSSQNQEYNAGSYFTDTITVNASTVYVQDSIISSTGILMAGAYHDPVFGNVYNKAFAQLHMANQNVDYSGAVVNATTLRIDYAFGYGDTLQDQTFDVYELPAPLVTGQTYYTISPEPDLSTLTPIGSATFQARPNTPQSFIDITLDNAYGKKLLDASNTLNAYFVFNIYGIAIVPRDQDKGAVVPIILSSTSALGASQTLLAVNYTKNGLNGNAFYAIDNSCARYYTSSFDRSGTVLSGLTSSYSELSSVAAGNNAYMQSMNGLKLKVSFPYIKEFLFQAGGKVLINKAALYVPISGGTNAEYKEPSGLAMILTDENDKELKSATGVRYVQSDFNSAVGTGYTEVFAAVPNESSYYGRLTTYLLANQLQQLPYNRSLFVSPFYNSLQVNRLIVNTSALKLQVYYTIVQ